MENQNINLIDNSQNKKSKLFVWIATILLGAVVGLGALLSTQSNKYLKSSAYSVDENNYSITLDSNEVLIRLTSFCDYIFTDYGDYFEEYMPSLSYDNRIFEIDELTGSYVSYFNNDNSIYFVISDNLEGDLPSSVVSQFYYLFVSKVSYSEFEYLNSSLTINFNTREKFDNALPYIINDLDSSSSYPSQSWLEEIITLLTGGITGIASGVGNGVSTLVGDIFVSNGALSVFGATIVIFGGVSLAIGLCRWVMNFLTSLGAKK